MITDRIIQRTLNDFLVLQCSRPKKSAQKGWGSVSAIGGLVGSDEKTPGFRDIHNGFSEPLAEPCRLVGIWAEQF